MVLGAAVGLLVLASSAAGAGEPLTTARVASALNRPVFVTHAPGDESRLFIVEQRGVIRILDLGSGTMIGNFLDIDALVVNLSGDGDERGLLGMAFHPGYAGNGMFYVCYTNLSANMVVARYTVSANPNIANAGSGVTILTWSKPQSNHNGGCIGFGPDGYLYVGTGDGGNFCDTGTGHTASSGNAQDITTNLLGKMLRINPSTTPSVGGYTIPPGNPFVGISGDDEIWAYGLRNPWRWSFDSFTGDLYIGDVGQDTREEIDFRPGSSIGGENYGWRCFEGNSCSSVSGCSTTPCGCVPAGLVMPIHEYSHGGGQAVTGGYVYRGRDIPGLLGTYFFADYASGRIWSFKLVGGAVTAFTERTAELAPGGGLSIDNVSSFGEDGRGELYLVDHGSTTTGEVYKILPDCGKAFSDLGSGLAGVNGIPRLVGCGTLAAGSSDSLTLTSAAPSSPALLFVALASTPTPFKGGVLVAIPITLMIAVVTDATGTWPLSFVWPPGVPALTTLYFQYAIKDAAGPFGASLSNGLKGVTP